ncbi:2-succinylbenzoate-CoA ligase [Phormidesmis priestleyi ULC007]|uniref:2-succinylbenzoate-CoA ligase n=1 Tax=Phormidesmis priestleyi ULC007 TaxID=1920490 RepID=A0A2T1DLS9_9CYAN|nr:2-succinylbenzoate--CoA ligase [Phormidesmis priestleyi]PSB21443.1 2-succinylbenzoate-CoA ligase [Phormidesmis priestleyi ULC007]PZO48591.1 MAG: 2-succinylbenzoate--CoA ligase [Phormidesmis priestleyi]
MAKSLIHHRENWLGYSNRELNDLADQRYQALKRYSTPPTILLAERNPIEFLAGFLAACSANCSIFLCNPDWVEAEWQQVFDLVEPDLIWGESLPFFNVSSMHSDEPPPNPQVWGSRSSKSPKLGGFRGQDGLVTKPSNLRFSKDVHPTKSRFTLPDSPLIMIPTGGTSGKIRFAMHTWETLTASVQGFQQYFGVDRVHSFCVLPLYHVSGLMQFMRSFLSDGQLVILPWKALEAGEAQSISPQNFFLSLVPTQLQKLLYQPQTISWLSQFETILLGGAPAWSDLLDQARSYHLPIAPTYGMTETASQIVTLKPEDFLKGKFGSGQALPHTQITIQSETGEPLKMGETGKITIQTDSLMLGYYPNFLKQTVYQPDDLGFFDSQGCLQIVGRDSNKIITGGENVFPAEVEAAIIATKLVKDVCVLGISDRIWGQAITAVYVPQNSDVSNQALITSLDETLSKFKRPKYWISLEKLPRNPQGKINYLQLRQIIAAKTGTPTTLAKA